MTKAVTVPNCAWTTSGWKDEITRRNLRHSFITLSGAVRDPKEKVSVITPAAAIGAFCLSTKGIDAPPAAQGTTDNTRSAGQTAGSAVSIL